MALIALPAVAALLALSACTSGGTGKAAGPSQVSSGSDAQQSASSSADSNPSTSAADRPAVITATPAATHDVSPVAPIAVTVANGILTSVKLVNPEGKVVSGALASDGSSWHATEPLGYSRSYKLTAVADNATGSGVHTYKRTFTTLTPANQTMPYLDTIYGTPMVSGATYGVGMIPVVHFDEQITDRKAAEKAMQVTTSPHVDGSWYWLDSQSVHWRPERYYAPGTRVSIHAAVYGVNLGAGLYGQTDKSVSFKIGAKHISVADAKTHLVKVYFSGKMVRTMPTSMGRGGYVQGKNGQIALWTMPGTYTVIGHENPAIMSSNSYGLPANSPLGYAPEKVYYSTKISTDGIYLHELDATVWAQGHSNVSHGCLNLNKTNAMWFFSHSRVGDVVIVRHSGGPAIQVWQGGDWSVPWATWKASSALS